MQAIAPTSSDRVNLLPLHIISAFTGHKQNPIYRPNGAPFYHIFAVEKGSGVFEADGTRITLYEGTVIFIKKDYPINYYANGGDFYTRWVTYDGPCAAGLADYYRADGFVYCKSEHIIQMISQCQKLASSGASADILSKAAYDLIVTFFNRYHEQSNPLALTKAKEFIEKNYSKDLSLAEIADAAGVSQFVLTRLFRKLEQITPIEYLRSVRIKNAKQLLLCTPAISVAGIAAKCGFVDSSYFCKVFKSQTGMSPKAYAKLYSF